MAVSFLLVLVAVPAFAQSDDALGRARSHFEAGRALYNLGNYTEAEREFAAGYELAPRPQFLVNLGNCYRKLDNLPKAREMFQRYLAETRADDPLRPQAEQVLAEVEHDIASRPPAKAQAKTASKPAIEPTPQSQLEPAATVAAQPAASSVDLTAHASPKKPFIKRHWWIIPVSAVVVGAAVGLGVYYGTRSDPCHGANLTCWDLSK